MDQRGKLTRYPLGSLREIWAVAFPLMLMTFSNYTMLFADRMILSQYGMEAMNASAVASATYTIFMFGSFSLALIAEVFVGQYNGAGNYKKMGQPVWQMLWFALFSVIIFWPLALFLGEVLFTNPKTVLGIPYFKCLMFFGPVVPMIGALEAFNVGRGKTLAITIIAIIANLTNIGLDYLLVFGFRDIVPSLGLSGAAIATGIAQSLQVVTLFVLFLRPKHRKEFGTGNFRFNKKAFFKCLKVGSPMAISHAVAIAAWALFNNVLAETSVVYMTTIVICQNYFFVFCFFTEGLGKAVTTIAANLIGAKKQELITKMLKSALRLHVIFVCILAIPLVIYSKPFLGIFLQGNNINSEVVPQILDMLKSALFWMWLTSIFNGLFWIYSSQLTAAGDTKFVMYANMISAWVFLLLPTYLFIIYFQCSPSLSWKLITLDIFMASLMFYLRYRSGKWRQFQLIQD
ncbi:MAG: hypothetical protein C5B43_03355 [Verrucomicrobia bacterium]|nr:MAG: hypothetical protein C5B43_03355 [Verrucomicrobiota bacterium]